LRSLPAVDQSGLLSTPARHTPTYTKPMLMESNRPERELNRLDIKNRTPISKRLEDQVLGLIDSAWLVLDAILGGDQVSEEDCGVVTKRVRDRIAKLAAKEPAKFVLADSRDRIHCFEHVAVKPNQAEFDRLPIAASARTVFVTRGERGILILPGETTVPAYPVAGPIDVVGAGDSCAAGIACAMIAGATPEEAAAFGNLIASITIQQLGTTGTASPEQVL